MWFLVVRVGIWLKISWPYPEQFTTSRIIIEVLFERIQKLVKLGVVDCQRLLRAWGVSHAMWPGWTILIQDPTAACLPLSVQIMYASTSYEHVKKKNVSGIDLLFCSVLKNLKILVVSDVFVRKEFDPRMLRIKHASISELFCTDDMILSCR